MPPKTKGDVMIVHRHYKIEMPPVWLMEQMYKLDIESIKPGYENKISFLVRGDTLHGFMDHLSFLRDLKLFVSQKGAAVRTEVHPGNEWVAEIYKDDILYRRKSNTCEYGAMLDAAIQFMLGEGNDS